jgi:ubiquinone/menaquinone biosynthesis C-methylase UbiE
MALASVLYEAMRVDQYESMSDIRTAKSSQHLGTTGIHENWKSVYLNPDIAPMYELAFDRIVQELRATPNSSILDAGCGYGYHAIRLARRGLAVTGVDFSPVALRAARSNIDAAHVGAPIKLQQGDLLKLHFADGSFDSVNCWGVLMHIPEVETALRELARVLRPGGRLALMENNANSLHVRFWEPTVRSLKRLLGRRLGSRVSTQRGIEEWTDADAGGLLVRKTDMEWLTGFYANIGMQLKERIAGQFTELYVQMPGRAIRRLVHRFNYRWLAANRSPHRAMGNILIFEKSR